VFIQLLHGVVCFEVKRSHHHFLLTLLVYIEILWI